MKTLLIDDDKIFVMICKKLMSRTNFCEDVVVCENGLVAIEYLKNITAPYPDAILLDLNMPVMNGWDFLDHYLTWTKETLIKIPIFILSSTVHNSDFEKAAQYSIIKGFFSKPLSINTFDEIKAIMDSLKNSDTTVD